MNSRVKPTVKSKRSYSKGFQTTLEYQSEFALDLYYEFFLGDNRVQKDNDEDDSDPNDTDVNAEQTLKDN